MSDDPIVSKVYAREVLSRTLGSIHERMGDVTEEEVFKALLDEDKPERITVEQAGSRGGKATRDKHGLEYYTNLGKQGGAATSAKYGPDHYRELGQKGGAKTKEKYGIEHYRRVGARGGRVRPEPAPPSESEG